MADSKNVPLVAVITRTKDRPLFLERAIKSVHDQTMKDFVHVILNDGGRKEPVNKLVKKYREISDAKIEVIHNDIPHGADKVLNQAIKSVKSKYVAIIDDDDSWHEDFLKITTAHLEKTGAMGVVTRTDRIEEVIENGKIVRSQQDTWLPDVHEVNLYKQCLDMIAVTVAFVYKRSVFKDIGYYDEQMPVSADWEFTIRFLLKYDIDFIDHKPALANYHHRPAVKGINGNSVFEQRHLHDYYVNQIRNKYLREDIKQGKLGVGYIMNSLPYERERESLQTVRLEGHINYSLGQLEDKLMQKLNRNLYEILNRMLGVRIYRKAKGIVSKNKSH